jgi:type I restriction enzyme S subunit
LVTSSGPTDYVDEARVRGPGVTTGRSGSIGGVFFIEQDFWPLNTSLYVRDFHGNDEKYVFYLLQSLDLERFSSGAGVPTLNRNHIHSEPVLIARDIGEQKRIVAVLDKAFAALDRARANAEANLADAGELFSSAVDHVFRASNEWPRHPISSIGKVFDGPHATPKTIDEGPLFLGISSLVDGRIELSKTRHVSEEDFAKWTRRVTPKPGDVVFSYETRLGQVGLIPEGMECCLGRRMGLVRLRKEIIDPEYFTLCYLSPQFQRFLRGKTVEGATVDRLSIKEFPNFPFPTPDKSIQSKIVEEMKTFRLRCSIPDDHIDPRRSALFMARSILREVREGVGAC